MISNLKTFSSQGSKYWRFSAFGKLDRGYPKPLDKGFSGIPTKVDAAMVWPENDKIYFFKGSNYWKFDPDRCTMLDVIINDLVSYKMIMSSIITYQVSASGL